MTPDRDALDALTRLLSSDLTGATVDELADLLRRAEGLEVVAKGRAVSAMRDAGASWRQIAGATGRGSQTVRDWYRLYHESRESPEQ